MEKKYVLAIDQSTQGTKAIIFDNKGDLVCREDLPHKQIINDKGWVSHDLNEIYDNVIQVIKNVIERSKIDKNEIACLGISNQRETSAAWDKITGKPLAHAVVWQCSRAEEICERIRNHVVTSGDENVADIILKKTGMHLSPYFPAAKLAWLIENEEAVKNAKKENRLCMGTIDTYLVYRLTGGRVYATDYSNASRTQLFNINTLEWDDEICTWFGVCRDILPEVRDSSGDFGCTDLEGFWDEPIPICSVIGDSQGALFGQGCIHKGMVKATYGTGSSVMMNVGENAVFSELGLVTSLAWGIDGKVNYVLEGNINYSAAVIAWLKDDIGLIKDPNETEELARLANQSDTTYLVPAFSGLGAPYWKADAKAVLYGMTRTTTRNEIVKAALESIAYQITDIVEMMKAENDIHVETLCADGGATKNKYLMQFQSDILGVKIKLSECEESSAQGAAYMAGLQCGIYARDAIFDKKPKVEYQPILGKEVRESKYIGWKNAVSKVVE